MLKNEMMAKRVMELMGTGKSMEEALQIALNEAVAPKKIEGERSVWMSQLEDLQELRKAVASSQGMKSKMKTNPVAVARYTEEITVGQARVKELLAQIETAADPVAVAVKYNAEPKDILRFWIPKKYEQLEELFETTRAARKISKADAKTIRNQMDGTTPASIERELRAMGETILAEYNDRLRRRDQLVETMNRIVRFCGIES